MANRGLFASAVARLLPRTDTVNREGATAYVAALAAAAMLRTNRQARVMPFEVVAST